MIYPFLFKFTAWQADQKGQREDLRLSWPASLVCFSMKEEFPPPEDDLDDMIRRALSPALLNEFLQIRRSWLVLRNVARFFWALCVHSSPMA